MAPGLTTKNGDSQNNRTQVNMGNTVELDSNGNTKLDNKSERKDLAVTGAHEDLHTVGLKHGDDKSNINRETQNKDNNNIMNGQYGDKKTNVTPDQRTQVINLIEKQQPKQ